MREFFWFFDFHSHRNVNIGRNPDPVGIARTLAEAGVTEMTTHAKSHDGYTYYPTDLKTCYRHPRMVGDPFGDTVKACVDAGLRALAYISFGIDGEGSRHNPHWRQFSIKGPMENDDWFISTCPYTPYTDDCVLPQIEEVCKRYPVGGFFFDTMGALGPCYCPYCEKAFKEDHSLELPRQPEDEGWDVYGKWRHDRGIALLDRISAFIQQLNPGAAVGFNQIGSPPFPEKMPAGCTRLTLDFATYGHQSRQASRCAAYGSTAPTPADVMPTIFNGGWGDWTPAPPQRNEQIAVAIWARGGTAYMGDRLHPDNRLAKPTYVALSHVSAVHKAVEEHGPTNDSSIAPDILLLHGTAMQYGADYRHFAIDSRVRLRPLDGASDLLLDAGANYCIAAEFCLADWIDKVRMVIVPQLEAIATDTARRLEAFAAGGGQVLFVGNPPMVDGKPFELPGIAIEEKPWQDHIYLPPVDKGEMTDPVLIRGDYFKVVTKSGTQIVSRAIQPVDMTHGVRFGWGISPPSDEPSEHAIVTRRPVGKGFAWTLAAPLFASYQDMGNWQQVIYMADLLNLMLPKPAMKMVSPYGQVEVVAHATDKTTWAFLVNHGGEYNAENAPRIWPRTWGPVPAYPITLVIHDAKQRRVKQIAANGQPVHFKVDASDGCVHVSHTLDAIWRVIRIDWE